VRQAKGGEGRWREPGGAAAFLKPSERIVQVSVSFGCTGYNIIGTIRAPVVDSIFDSGVGK